MILMRDISKIIEEGGSALERLLREAFESGVAHGREEVRRQLEGFLGAPAPLPARKEIVTAANDVHSPPRATPGTVKPSILQLVQDNDGCGGITTEAVIDKTGFKPNSVRGTLSTLALEKTIIKIGDKWRLVANAAQEGAVTDKAPLFE